MATSIIARRTGIYRCTGLGQTKHATVGEQLPAHDSCPGGCEWDFKGEDNLRPEKVTVIIGDDPFYVLVIDEVPQVGDRINLRSGLVGNYRVTKVDTVTENAYMWPRILVERMGDQEKDERVHAVGSVQL